MELEKLLEHDETLAVLRDLGENLELCTSPEMLNGPVQTALENVKQFMAAAEILDLEKFPAVRAMILHCAGFWKRLANKIEEKQRELSKQQGPGTEAGPSY